MRLRLLDAPSRRCRVLAVAPVLLPAAAGAQSPRPERLTGAFFLDGATLVDPPPGESSRSHACLSVTGTAARRLFDALPGPAVDDACQPGRRLKRSGHLTCSAGRRASEVRCDIALARGEQAPAPPC